MVDLTKEFTPKEVYGRLVSLESRVDRLLDTKLETLKELRWGTFVLIFLALTNLLVHLILVFKK